MFFFCLRGSQILCLLNKLLLQSFEYHCKIPKCCTQHLILKRKLAEKKEEKQRRWPDADLSVEMTGIEGQRVAPGVGLWRGGGSRKEVAIYKGTNCNLSPGCRRTRVCTV